ncbi:MAG: dihydropteroate synthase [Candidatus Competibacteraceae bacterium]|nr:dihydropteroate synthase [Candidatus Competibacteraceae bacterium]
MTVLNCGGRALQLDRPVVMGVLNVTPDSFSDGGRYTARDKACRRAVEMVAEGAALIDIGAESTRPGAQPVSVEQELERIVPILDVLVRDLPVPISIDTSKPQVMQEVLQRGAGMINDVRALQAEGALDVVAASTVSVCLMHMQGEPGYMQDSPEYGDVLVDIRRFLESRLLACEVAGIRRDRIVIDPGFGFGKTLAHNLTLLKRLSELHRLGVPLLVGLSRKSMLGKLLDAPVDERLFGGLAAAVIAAWQGAKIIRTHDVKATTEALCVCHAIMGASD